MKWKEERNRYYFFSHIFWSISENKILKNTEFKRIIEQKKSIKLITKITSLDNSFKAISVSRKIYETFNEFFHGYKAIHIENILKKLEEEFLKFSSSSKYSDLVNFIITECFHYDEPKLQILKSFTKRENIDDLLIEIKKLKKYLKTNKKSIYLNILNFSSGTDLKILRKEKTLYNSNLHTHFSFFGYFYINGNSILDNEFKEIINTIVYLIFVLGLLNFYFTIKRNNIYLRKNLKKFVEVIEPFLNCRYDYLPVGKAFIVGYFFDKHIRKENGLYILDGINDKRVDWDRLILKEVYGRVELVNPSKYIVREFKKAFGDDRINKVRKENRYYYEFKLKNTKIFAKTKEEKEYKQKLLNSLIEKSKYYGKERELNKIKIRILIDNIIKNAKNEEELIKELQKWIFPFFKYENLYGLSFIHKVLDTLNYHKKEFNNFNDLKNNVRFALMPKNKYKNKNLPNFILKGIVSEVKCVIKTYEPTVNPKKVQKFRFNL